MWVVPISGLTWHSLLEGLRLLLVLSSWLCVLGAGMLWSKRLRTTGKESHTSKGNSALLPDDQALDRLFGNAAVLTHRSGVRGPAARQT